jgi:hypothetical protein
MTDPSPLEEASKSSLAELFSMDPLKLTRSDRSAIVAEFRRVRAIWATAQAAGKQSSAARAPKALKGTAPDISLDDLLK